MNSVLRTIASVLVLLTLLPGYAITPSREHSKWLNLPMERLLDMADRDFSDGGNKDTALMCYTIVTNRYEASMSREQKLMCKDAAMRLWSIYFYDF